MTIKTNFFFSKGKAGWSETYYGIGTDLRIGFNNALALLRQRALLAAAPTVPEAIRVSLVGSNRKSILAAVGASTPYPVDIGAYTFPSDLPSSAALCNIYSISTTQQRPLYLRGNPDSLIQEGAQDNADALTWFQQVSGAFQNELKNNNWFIQYRQTIGTDAQESAITAWVNLPGTLFSSLTLDLAGPLTFAAGDHVQIYRVPGARPTPGAPRVLAVDATGKILTIRYSLPEDFRMPGGGVARKLAFQYGVISELNFERFVSKKTGRPFGLSAGRRRSTPR